MNGKHLIYIVILLMTACGGDNNGAGVDAKGSGNIVDVVLTTMSAPAAANAGDTITVQSNVVNEGGSLTGGIAVYYYLSLDNTITTNDTSLVFDVILLLNPGDSASSNKSITLPDNLPSGTYYIGVWADKDNIIPETNEDNNKRVSTISVTGTNCSDDEYEENDTGTTANIYQLGAMQRHTHCSDDNDWVAFDAIGGTTYGIMTSELGALADTRLELYSIDRTTRLAMDNDGGYIGQSSLLNWLAPSSGTYYIRATTQWGLTQIGPNTDYNLTIAEPAPDLTISGIGINGSMNLTSGDLIPITYTVNNQGIQDATSTELGFYLSTDATVTTDDLLIGTVDIVPLNPGDADSDSLDFWAPLPGNVAEGRYYLAAIADHSEAVSEMNESNNTSANLAVTINAAPCDSDAFEEDDTWQQASAATINEVRSHNFCDDWADYVYVDLQASDTVIIKANGTAGPIDPYIAVYDSTGTYLGGESDDISQNADYVFTAPATSRYYIAAKTAGSNYGGSTYDRAYNFSIMTETPDLSLYSMNIRQLALYPGSTAFVSTTLNNTGYVDATNFQVSYHLSIDNVLDGNDTLLGTRQFAIATAGNWTSQDAQLSIPETITPGSYYLLINIDPNNQVAETNEGNNSNINDYVFTIGAEICAADQYENNDTADNAKDIAIDTTQTHNRCDDQLDWIRLNAIANQQYLFSASDRAYMRLFDTDMSTELTGATQYLHWEAPADGFYYILLAPEYYRDLSGSNSSHTITLQTCNKDSYEEDDSTSSSAITNPAPIAAGQTQSRNHCDDKTDWLVFDAASGNDYTITTDNLGNQSDTVLTLYNSNAFSPEASNDNRNGSTLASRITWTAPADGQYYILVENRNIGSNTEYDISLTTP